jgi:hypothetical protein
VKEGDQDGIVTLRTTPQTGDFVRVRTRRWLVEAERSAGEGLAALRLACVDDDAQGEVVEVLWDAELDGSILQDEGWASVAKFGTDDPKHEHGRRTYLARLDQAQSADQANGEFEDLPNQGEGKTTAEPS